MYLVDIVWHGIAWYSKWALSMSLLLFRILGMAWYSFCGIVWVLSRSITTQTLEILAQKLIDLLIF